MSALEEQLTLFDAYPPQERVINKAFSRPLVRYIEFLENIHDMVLNLKEKCSRGKLDLFKAFSKVKVDAGEIRRLNRDIEDKHKKFMEALGLFTALRIQTIE